MSNLVKQFYKIATCSFFINGLYIDKYWNNFLITEKKQFVNCKIEILSESVGRYGLEYFKLNEEEVQLVRYFSEIMLVDKEWKQIRIFPPVDIHNISTFLLQIFHAHAVHQHMIQIHSSMINYQESGILFLGPSGIGKTTQAELWNNYLDALIINGDMNFVQETSGGFIGWGTPWHGSSPYCENTSVQVRALIVLKQASDNSIRKLEGFEKVHAVSNNVIYPTWLENGMELCLETLDHLLSKIPVYELSCRPDEDAVRLVEETVFK